MNYNRMLFWSVYPVVHYFFTQRPVHPMYRIYIPVLLSFIFLSCEEEFFPDTTDNTQVIVVEGYIEAGERPASPYVILTRSQPFFTELGADALNNLFVHDALVEVSDGERVVQLTELCLADLSPEQRALAGALFGFNPDSIGFNFCAYVDLSQQMPGEIGGRYDLSIQVEGQELSATTTIPDHVPLDSFKFEEPPGEPNDTLVQMLCYVTDPGGQVNFYRYLTKVNSSPFISGFTSVIDDRLFDGQEFEFPLAKAEPRDAPIDPNTFGLYLRGDTVGVKWINLDEAHYNFWNTLEFNSSNQGPFSSYTRVSSNIVGGLGIWGGLSASYYEAIIPD